MARLCRKGSDYLVLVFVGAGALASAQRELKSWGVVFTDGGRKRLVTAQEARDLRAQGKRPGPGAVLTPLAKEILE